jgi:hypothetical protein
VSLDWANRVLVNGVCADLEVRRDGAERRRRIVIRSSSAASGAQVLDMPEHYAIALRDVLNAMYPPESRR